MRRIFRNFNPRFPLPAGPERLMSILTPATSAAIVVTCSAPLPTPSPRHRSLERPLRRFPPSRSAPVRFSWLTEHSDSGAAVLKRKIRFCSQRPERPSGVLRAGHRHDGFPHVGSADDLQNTNGVHAAFWKNALLVMLGYCTMLPDFPGRCIFALTKAWPCPTLGMSVPSMELAPHLPSPQGGRAQTYLRKLLIGRCRICR